MQQAFARCFMSRIPEQCLSSWRDFVAARGQVDSASGRSIDRFVTHSDRRILGKARFIDGLRK